MCFETLIAFLTENAVVLGAVGSIVFLIGWAFSIIKAPFKRDKPVALAPDTIQQIAQQQSKNGAALTTAEFIRVRRELKADIEAELARAPDAEKDQLRARIAELERQIADPEPALEEAKARIADLEARLERLGNEIGGDRLAEARAALEKGDYSIADDIFAEIEARAEMEVLNAARAAFGRGEIAGADVRWGDAAEHYAKAARLDPSYETLVKAGYFLSRAGRYAEAISEAEKLVVFAKDAFGQRHEKTATSLNNLAMLLEDTGRFEEAEPLFVEALSNLESAFGAQHPQTQQVFANLERFRAARGGDAAV